METETGRLQKPLLSHHLPHQLQVNWNGCHVEVIVRKLQSTKFVQGDFVKGLDVLVSCLRQKRDINLRVYQQSLHAVDLLLELSWTGFHSR
jgi:hypothetical protein